MSERTIREALHQASSLLLRDGIEDARRQAQLIMEKVLGWNRTQFLLGMDEPFPQEKEAELESMVERRSQGEPLQYIIGEQEFYGLPFQVNPAVLIPRPETELLVEEVIKRGQACWADELHPPQVLDVGTGSGAIAITLAVQCPNWRITASDISEAALATARKNALLNEVADRIDFVQGDLLAPWLSQRKGSVAREQSQDCFAYDILVSNPPYISEEDIAGLQLEVRSYEPHTALSGGADGLRIYARLCEQLKQLARKPRLVALEVGKGQHEAVSRMLKTVGAWNEMTVIPDLAGIQRHVIAFRSK